MNTITRVFPTSANPHPQDETIATYNARDLIENGVQAHIVLDTQVYTLRITRAGKLILTK
ncbi:MAG: hemin uptake protein HemP [Pseudomonadota bacterium]